MTVQSFRVTGMTCSHCETAVATEIRELAGVDDVVVDLVPGGVSIVQVTSSAPLGRDEVATALDEAGDYRLTEDG